MPRRFYLYFYCTAIGPREKVKRVFLEDLRDNPIRRGYNYFFFVKDATVLCAHWIFGNVARFEHGLRRRWIQRACEMREKETDCDFSETNGNNNEQEFLDGCGRRIPWHYKTFKQKFITAISVALVFRRRWHIIIIKTVENNKDGAITII